MADEVNYETFLVYPEDALQLLYGSHRTVFHYAYSHWVETLRRTDDAKYRVLFAAVEEREAARERARAERRAARQGRGASESPASDRRNSQ